MRVGFDFLKKEKEKKCFYSYSSSKTYPKFENSYILVLT